MKPNSKHMEWADKILNGLHVEDFSPKENIAEIAQHLAAFEAEVTGWKPIDSDAKEKGRILAVTKNGEPYVCYWDAYGGGMWFINGTTLAIAPTHYREITLPAQPEKEVECETCGGDALICADIPSLRHCEKANREKEVG